MLQVNYEASGWVVHQVSDIWAKTSPDRGEAVWALWPMGGAWLCTHLWEHYTYTLDKVSRLTMQFIFHLELHYTKQVSIGLGQCILVLCSLNVKGDILILVSYNNHIP